METKRYISRLLVIIGILFIAVFLTWSLTIWLPSAQPGHAAAAVIYVAPGGECGGETPCYGDLQAAIDAAAEAGEIRIATGIYTDVYSRQPSSAYSGSGTITQVVYLTKTLYIQGGFTTTDWTTPDPDGNPTVLNAMGMGRVIYIDGSDALNGSITTTLQGLEIVGGEATGLGGGLIGRDAGGGVYVKNASLTLENCEIAENASNEIAAIGTGGGVYVLDGIADIHQNSFRDNFGWDGGGLVLVGSRGSMSENEFVENWSNRWTGGGGGAAVFMDSTTTIRNNNFISNTSNFDGGGLFLVRSDITMERNGFVGNYANSNGGAVYFDGFPSNSVNMANNYFDRNEARGAAGAGFLRGGQVIVTGSRFENNSSLVGGALYLTDANGSLRQNVLTGNTTPGDFIGGGIYIGFQSVVDVDENLLIGNASGVGGGLFIANSAQVTMTNNVLLENQAERAGGGLYNEGALRMLQTTAVSNTAGDGSGISIRYSPPILDGRVWMTNTIMVSHTIGISVSADALVSINGVLWYGNGANTGGSGGITVSNQIVGESVFAADGYHLTATSAAIDNGVNATVLIDIDGEPRPNEGYDLGADEFWPPDVLLQVHLPVIFHAP